MVTKSSMRKRRTANRTVKYKPTKAILFDGYCPCIKLHDFSRVDVSTSAIEYGVDAGKLDAARPALVDTFLSLNRELLDLYGIKTERSFTESGEPRIVFETHDFIGACPLVSPITGRFDLGVVIAPRIQWSGLGSMLTAMGWKVVPELQRIAPLPMSDREIPNWVLSSVIVSRIERLLRDMSRQYEIQHENLSRPRGWIVWQEYVTKNMPQADLSRLPCEFSALEDNRTLLGVVHHILRVLQDDLQAQLSAGEVVLSLLLRIEQMLGKVSIYPEIRPTSNLLSRWVYGGLQPPALDPALEAIRWIAEGRGLAGLSDLNGLPWKMSMSAFYEAYVESIVKKAVRYSGGEVFVGRNSETDMNLHWDASVGASQRSLIPDIVVRRGDQTVIIDAKFKNFKLEMSVQEWIDIPEMSRDEHRHDLLQVLAYTTAYSFMPLSACLVYPVTDELYGELKRRKCLHQHALLSQNGRDVDIILTAVPLRGDIDDVAEEFANSLIDVNWR